MFIMPPRQLLPYPPRSRRSPSKSRLISAGPMMTGWCAIRFIPVVGGLLAPPSAPHETRCRLTVTVTCELKMQSIQSGEELASLGGQLQDFVESDPGWFTYGQKALVERRSVQQIVQSL